MVQRSPVAFSRAIARLGEFLVRGEPAPRRDGARGYIFVLRARDLAFQSRTCAENEQGRSRSRSQATGGRTDAHRAFQSLLRAAAHIGYGADRALAHAAIQRRIIFPRRIEGERAEPRFSTRGRSSNGIRLLACQKRSGGSKAFDVRFRTTRS